MNSTTEAKYVTACDVVNETAVWMRKFELEVVPLFELSISLYHENNGA